MAAVEVQSATMYLSLDSGESFDHSVCVMILESAMGLDNVQLSHVTITITDWREDSSTLIIDYSLESNVHGLLETAISNIDDQLGETITIGDLKLELDSNQVETSEEEFENGF